MWFADEFDECSYYEKITTYCPHCNEEDEIPYGNIEFSSNIRTDKIYACCKSCYNDFMNYIANIKG